jgi:D-galactonate transporter
MAMENQEIINKQTLEYALYRKVSWRLLPFLFLLFVVAYLDRMNISFAKLQMNSDLGFSDTVYGLGAGIFFLGYFFFEVPSNLILHRVGAKIWLARIIILWGFISIATLWVNSVTSFYGLRFLLGVGEAGFFPGVIYYLTLWYPNTRRTQTISLFLLAIPVTGILGSLVSGWIMTRFDNLHGLHGWQWLFVIEGIPAVLLGVLSFFVLSDSPSKAAWLSDAEKALLLGNLVTENLSNSQQHTSLKEILSFKPLWHLAIIYFLLVTGLYGISFWLPQIIRDFGTKDLISIGLLTAIPYAVAMLGMTLIGIHSDKTQERYWHLIACAASTCVGFILTVAFEHALLPSLLAFSLATMSVLSSIAIFWSFPTALLSGRLAAGGIAMINSIGGLGGYAAPALLGWLRDITLQMESGLLSLALAQAAAIWLILQLIPTKVCNT